MYLCTYTLKLQVHERQHLFDWPVQENNFDIHIFSVFMEKILKEVRHRFIGDVATNHNVPAVTQGILVLFQSVSCFGAKFCHTLQKIQRIFYSNCYHAWKRLH